MGNFQGVSPSDRIYCTLFGERKQENNLRCTSMACNFLDSFGTSKSRLSLADWDCFKCLKSFSDPFDYYGRNQKKFQDRKGGRGGNRLGTSENLYLTAKV